MRAKVAKRLRRESLGEGYSVRERIYGQFDSGQITCLGGRAAYKANKKNYLRRPK